MGFKITRKTGVQASVFLVLTACITNALALVPEVSYRPPSEAISTPTHLQEKPSQFSADMLDRVINFESEKLADQRSRFLKAENALHKRQYKTFRRLLPGLVDYPLYPYLRYQDFKRRISRVSSKELEEFFKEFGSQPVTQSLRSKLLDYTARKGQWKRFLTFYTPQNNARLQCYYSYALIRTGNAEAAYPEIEKLWSAGKSQPRNCDRVFKKWKSAGKLTSELAWKRFELAVNNGHRSLARYLVRSLPPNDRKLARTWIKLYSHPARLNHYLSKLLDSTHVMAPTILNSVIKRLARKDPQQAAVALGKTEIRTHLAEQDYYNLVETLAISLSRQHLIGAEYWFSQVPNKSLSNLGREWQIRVALRQSEWQTALSAINGLPQHEQESDRWRYWRARVLYELGLETTAKTLFTEVAKNRSYYGFLAADRLNLPYVMKDHPHQPTAVDLFAIVQRPGIRRAHELLQLDRKIQARREWRQATKSMTNDARIDASKLAQRWGWAEQSILTMASTDSRDDIGLRFPLLLQDKVMTHSESASIDPAWTYGVIRRESAFVRDARSTSGAIGLMQLMPATAKHISSSTKQVRYRSSRQLTHADTNLALGTLYLNKMLKRFDGQTVLATAAYNAGAHRVERWLPKDNVLDAERWIENIPFKETREYVANVLAYTIIYADRLGMEGQRLKEWMTTVSPKNSSVVKNTADKEQLAVLRNDKTKIR